MKKIIVFIFIPLFLFSYQVEIRNWKNGQTFYGFLKENHIPFSFYYSLDKKIRKKVSLISNKVEIYLLKNGNTIKQALIPLNNKEQLQIIKHKDKYISKVVPIAYSVEEKVASINVENFLSYDVYRNTKNPYLARKIVDIFNDRINFRILPKNTKLDLYYKVKSRFGKVMGVDIIYAKITPAILPMTILVEKLAAILAAIN